MIIETFTLTMLNIKQTEQVTLEETKSEHSKFIILLCIHVLQYLNDVNINPIRVYSHALMTSEFSQRSLRVVIVKSDRFFVK